MEYEVTIQTIRQYFFDGHVSVLNESKYIMQDEELKRLKKEIKAEGGYYLGRYKNYYGDYYTQWETRVKTAKTHFLKYRYNIIKL